MEELFTVNLSINNQNIVYRVVFENEKYTFISETKDAGFQTFSLKRENDEWHQQADMPPELKKQAVDALEKYLLRQH